MTHDSYTDLEEKLARAQCERDEALEREKATAEVLQVISRSPGELKPVFQAMLANAVRLCEAKFGNLFLQISRMQRGKRASTLVAFSRARNRPSFRSCNRLNSSLSST